MINLNDYKQNIHSQNGEDGILAKVFDLLNVEKGYFCEFGAWDGKHLSNAYTLYEQGWSGCYIEADRRKFDALVKCIIRDDMHLVNALVTAEGENTLDRILSTRRGHSNIDLLSIDIDSDDLAVWRSVKAYRPTVVVIEYNPTIPIDIAYENPAGESKGNSALAIYRYATQNGYELIATTQSNLIFIEHAANAGRFCAFTLHDSQLELGFRFFFGYDGTLIRMQTLSEKQSAGEFFTVPWTGYLFTQPAPRAFRRFEGNRLMTFIGLWISVLSVAIRRPLTASISAIKYGIKMTKKS